MNKNYGLTNTELQIMELLWEENRPMAFREIMEVARNQWKKEWKVQTLNTFLNGLQKMGMIRAERGEESPYNEYHAMHTREQHIHKWTKEMVKVCYDNSFARLVEAFVGEGELGEDDQEALKRLLQ
ncbi:transcriptional regulator [Clostridiaceae bacterium]|nr:transcriptional regulator [Clostridiaceae bacterium]